MKHTEGKLEVSKPKIEFPMGRDDRLIHTKDGRHIAEVFEYQNHENKHGPAQANAQHLVDCWNGCVDIKNPLAVGELLEVCKEIFKTPNLEVSWKAFDKLQQAINRVEGR